MMLINDRWLILIFSARIAMYANFMVSILGRQGDAADVERFESFRQPIIERTQSWPVRARMMTRHILDDSSERIRDLILFRRGGR